MKKTIGFILFILTVSVVYWKRSWVKNQFVQLTAKRTETHQSNDGNSNQLTSGSFPVKFGDRNTYVLAIQKKLNRTYNANLSEDGIFGNNTNKALKNAGFSVPMDQIAFNMFNRSTNS